jgi:hypothetical protein
MVVAPHKHAGSGEVRVEPPLKKRKRGKWAIIAVMFALLALRAERGCCHVQWVLVCSLRRLQAAARQLV